MNKIIQSVFYHLFLSFLFISFYDIRLTVAMNGVEFPSALDMPVSRISQILAVSQDVYPFSLGMTDNKPAEGMTVSRIIGAHHYTVYPLFGMTGFESEACMGGIYCDDDNAEYIIIAHRGTICGVDDRVWVSDLITDFDCRAAPIKLLNIEGLIHSGFEKCHRSFFGKLQEIIEDIVHNNPLVEIYCSGHSLGATLATLTAIKISYHAVDSLETNQVKAVCFSSPRLGNQEFIEDVQNYFPAYNVLNFYCNLDIIAKLPPEFFGFQEFGIPIKTLFLERMADDGLYATLMRGRNYFLSVCREAARLYNIGSAYTAFVPGSRTISAPILAGAGLFVAITEAFAKILLDAHDIGLAITIERAFLYTIEHSRDEGGLRKAGIVPRGSVERNPFWRFCKKTIGL